MSRLDEDNLLFRYSLYTFLVVLGVLGLMVWWNG